MGEWRHPIGPVLAHYGARSVPQGRLGWTKMRCPFHDDRHASATVNTELNAFACFGCGIKGDTYTIIMEQEGVEYREALTLAEEYTGEKRPPLPAKSRSRSRVSNAARYNAGNRPSSPSWRSTRSATGT